MTHHTDPKRLALTDSRAVVEVRHNLDERLRQILDKTIAFVALLTPEGDVEHISQNALDAAGLSRDDVLGLPFWKTYWWSQDAKAQEQLRQAILDARAGQTSRYDAVIRGVNNARFHIIFQLSPVVGRNGTVTELVASGVDITERVADRQRLERLVHEMGHRIKNLLTTVMAMARMTQRTAQPDKAFDEFSTRLAALTAAHDALNDSSNAEAFFENLARRLMRPYRTIEGSRIAISGPKIRLAPSEAKMLALCLYELATNAIKYGALSNSEGRVSVVLSHPDEHSRTTFTWTESGGPPVVRPSRQGYGTRFIISTLQGLFSHGVSLDYRPEGLCLTASGPAAKLLSP